MITKLGTLTSGNLTPFGPFIDSLGNWYAAGIGLNTSTTYRFWVYKSTDEGDTWSQAGYYTWNLYSEYDDVDLRGIEQNDDIIVMVASDQHVGSGGEHWSDHYIHGIAWYMNDVDNWGTKWSVEGGTKNYFDSWYGAPAYLMMNQDNNNYAVAFTYRTTGSWLRPAYVRVVNNGFYVAQNIPASFPKSDADYPFHSWGRNIDGDRIAYYNYVNADATVDTGWRELDSDFALTANYGTLPTAISDVYAPKMLDPTYYNGVATTAFWCQNTGRLWRATSSDITYDDYQTDRGDDVYSVPYDEQDPEWIVKLDIINVSGTYHFRYGYIYRSGITSGATWIDIPDTSHTDDFYAKFHAARNGKLYAWHNVSWTEHELFEVCDLPHPTSHIAEATATIDSDFTSGTIEAECYEAQPIEDKDNFEWAKSDGTTTAIYQVVDERTENDSDWMKCEYTSDGTGLYRAKLTEFSEDPSGGQVYIKYSYWIDNGESYKSYPTLKVRLVEMDYGYKNYGLATEGATASAISYYPGVWMLWPALPPSNLVDGNDGTWHRCADDCPVSTGNCWKQVSYATAKTFNRLSVLMDNSYGLSAKWRLMCSDNGTDWTDVITVYRTSNPGSDFWEVHDFPARTAKHWRMKNDEGLSPGTGAWQTANFNVEFYEPINRTVIAEWTHTSVSYTSPETVVQNLTTEQFNAIVDWKKLYIEFEQVEA